VGELQGLLRGGIADGVTLASRTQAAFEASPLHALTSEGWEAADLAAAGKFWEVGSKVAKKLGLRNGLPHLLVNGRV
jgi:hypothetical protein